MWYQPTYNLSILFVMSQVLKMQHCRCLMYMAVIYTYISNLLCSAECSRAYHTASELLGIDLEPEQHFHCLSNGDYDELQCIGNNCYCIDAYDGNPSSSSMTAVNVSYISANSIDCCKYLQVLQGLRHFSVIRVLFRYYNVCGTYLPVRILSYTTIIKINQLTLIIDAAEGMRV